MECAKCTCAKKHKSSARSVLWQLHRALCISKTIGEPQLHTGYCPYLNSCGPSQEQQGVFKHRSGSWQKCYKRSAFSIRSDHVVLDGRPNIQESTTSILAPRKLDSVFWLLESSRPVLKLFVLENRPSWPSPHTQL